MPLTRIVPPRLLGSVYRFSEPFVYALHVRPMNRVRKEFGLSPLPANLRLMYTDGDFVLYPDIPEFVPTSNLPETHRYAGICEWNLPVHKPGWWNQAMAETKPKVFVTLRSRPSGTYPLHLGTGRSGGCESFTDTSDFE